MKRVWVTRDEGEDGRLSAALREAGLVPVVEPVLTTTLVSDAAGHIARLGPDDWLVLTSRRAIEAVATEPARVPQVAVVGEPSRIEAEHRGMRVALLSPTGYGEGLWAELVKRAAGRRICFARSSLAPLPDVPGLNVESVVVYDVQPRRFDSTVINRVDVTSFVSASAVDAVHCEVGRVPQPIASIGNAVSTALRRYGAEPAIESAEPTFASLAAAIADYKQ